MLQGKALYVTCEETCFNMTADEWVEVAELQSAQEAHTSLLLHAINNLHAFHAARTGSKTYHPLPKTPMSCCVVLLSKRISPVPVT